HLRILPPPYTPLFPYTTLFRSLLPPDAVPLPARGLRESLSLRVGGRAPPPLRSREDPRPLPRVPRRAGVRRGAGLRRPVRERAPQQRLRPHAVAEPHGRRAHAPDVAGGGHRARQQPRRLQPAAPRRRGVRGARPAEP